MKFLAAIVWLTGLVGALAAEPSPEAQATVVLYNRGDPASHALAEYYARRRDIPAGQLVGLPCAGDEEISRDAYRTTIEAPVRAAFDKFGWWQVERGPDGKRFVAAASKRFVAIMRGVPMKIRPTVGMPSSDFTREIEPGSPLEKVFRHNEASVDSELAALFALREDPAGIVGNPYYRRFSRIFDVPAGGSPLLVGRLDGPSDEIVRRMIDDSLAAERDGLWGWAYLDRRNIAAGPYAPGDRWLTDAGAMMRRQGIPVITDSAPETLREGFPMTDAAIYYGWYESNVDGPFAREDFRFPPGAIAVHLHSFSARTLRNPGVAWAAPLLARGAAATIGNVYEPYLELTVHFDVLQDRLMSGFTLAESAYAGFRGVSWMSVVVGDPLYRPYAEWQDLGGDDRPNVWRQYRSAVIAGGGDPVAAAAGLRALAKRTGKSMPLEALGQAQVAAGDIPAALETLEAAAAMSRTPAVRFRLALEQIEILRRVNRTDEARKRIAIALDVFTSEDEQLTLGRLALLVGPAAGRKP